MKRIAMLSLAATLLAFAAPGAGAAPISYQAQLSGAAETPSNASPGTGFTTVVYDSAARTLSVDVTFSGLQGVTTVAHIHCCIDPPGNVGVATQTPSFFGFPVGVTAGTFSQTFDLTDPSSWNAAFINGLGGGTIAGAEAALAAGLAAGQAYLNIHTDVVPAGEIRGFLAQVPEPGTLLLLGAALAGVGLSRRRF